MPRLSVLALAAALTASPQAMQSDLPDLDRDGLNDRFEQRLIERFQPRFFVSTSDCAGRPSAFAAETVTPTPTDANGTVYSHVMPVERPGDTGAWIEIQYFHIWARDCGWNAHPLDVEHVSTLVRADRRDAPPGEWKARYWYAAAHQDTVCDASHGARADSIGAIERGASVWIAKGKHASYLTATRCRWGCGTDRCPDSVPLEPPSVVNIGERDAPMHGAAWVASDAWPLGAQMASDFTPPVVARLDRTEPEQIVAVNSVRRTTKAFLMSTSAGAWGIVKGQQRARATLSATGRTVGRALKVTGRVIIGR